jgi:acyl carrier protein
MRYLRARRERSLLDACNAEERMDASVDVVRAGLLDFLCRNFVVSESDIDIDGSLIEQGVIDSFGLIEITAFINQRFGIEVREEDMTREAFGSLNKMARFVARRTDQRS